MVALQIRRVITGHDAAGKAVVTIDNVIENSHVGRPGATAYPVRSSEGFPVNNDWQEDEGLRKTGTTLLNGTIFRVLEFAPGLAPRNHRTDSIDYGVILSGEIDMELDGTSLHPEIGRRVRSAWDDPQLDQSRQRALHHCDRPHRREIGRGRRQDARSSRLVRENGQFGY